MALIFQQSTGGASGASQNSFSLAYSSITITGSYLVCCVQYDITVGTLSISDNVNGAWTKVVANDSLISEQFEVWVLPVNAGGAVTVEAQVNTGTSFFQLVTGEYTGQVTSGALDANTPLTEQTNPTATYGPVTTNVANDQLIFIGFTGSSTVWTPAMGFTSRILSSAAGSPILMDGIAAAAGSHSFSATASASALFGALLAIKALPSSGGGQGNQPAGNVIFDLDGDGYPIAELQTGTDA